MADRGYLHLLAHLTRPSTALALPTLRASLAHYLAALQPAPTPLAAASVSAPLFRAFAHARLAALCGACRDALHLRVRVHLSLHLRVRVCIGLFVRLAVCVHVCGRGEVTAAVVRRRCGGGF